MESTDRLRAIMTALRTSDSVSVAELALEHAVSEMTIRRDLDELAQQGVVRRVRGGAVSLLLRGEEPPFAVREREAAEVKRRVAAEVASLLSDGEAVLLDSGTTALEVARAIRDRRMTVLPLSLQSAHELGTAPRIRLVLPGGEVRPGELDLTGPLTEGAIRSLRFDTAVIGCCGLSAEHGLTAHDLSEAAVKQAAIASARRVVVATDSSKFTRTAFGAVCPLDHLDLVVTDDAIPPSEHDALTAAGVTVRTV
ncbi:DeoR/GlpR family DNA-binding transcription regulator [Planomonospora parontospora]|uniref:DeoR/GlpR family DNA-binding transcription regulator n=1 Tax=Planomonospora parontospora TaxID=58119 RepID=UPI0016701105|nr:DeoR/GlpR family DNA-binding transcription regulator [Planomonospora parontospora]GGL51138.1 DeoR family transcriptional regulator [Planomonospora parontospora subsp. antibiotica]GII19070.1 DeoR family transcriptional regulator [Planomonospora parontospora subsp. antibiotica]